MNSNLLSNISAIVLLIISPILGLMGNSTEMGLAILAGAIGLAFSNIDKICSFEGAGFKAEMWKKMETVVEKETETDPESEAIKSISMYKASDIDADENKILEALINQRYIWRTLSGISEESGVSEREAKIIINNLIRKGFAKEFNGVKDKIWSITNSGRRKLAMNTFLIQEATNS